MHERKTVFITGGSRGIGAACVKKFLEEGYDVFFTYRTTAETAEALVADCRQAFPARICGCIAADAGKAEDCAASYAAAKEALGHIDVLVNNAGIAEGALLQDITDLALARMMEVNLCGPFRYARLAASDMIPRQSGSIVNISSVWGELGAAMESHYSASKAGVIGMTKALAKELGMSGIRVNCVTPGVIDTDMNACHDHETMADLAACTALGRIGRPEEVAEAVFFLASDKASFITGQILGVNGQFPM